MKKRKKEKKETKERKEEKKEKKELKKIKREAKALARELAAAESDHLVNIDPDDHGAAAGRGLDSNPLGVTSSSSFWGRGDALPAAEPEPEPGSDQSWRGRLASGGDQSSSGGRGGAGGGKGYSQNLPGQNIGGFGAVSGKGAKLFGPKFGGGGKLGGEKGGGGGKGGKGSGGNEKSFGGMARLR